MVYGVELYGPMLDSVLEMAEDLMGGNGISAERAVNQVILDENWSILPTHRKLIVELLETA
jgi:hypothetical protein